jgi:SET domain-containing protein
MLRKYVRLNYSFTLNHRYHIDSARVGNETRYINHGSEEDEKANSMARSALLPKTFLYIPADFLI